MASTLVSLLCALCAINQPIHAQLLESSPSCGLICTECGAGTDAGTYCVDQDYANTQNYGQINTCQDITNLASRLCNNEECSSNNYYFGCDPNTIDTCGATFNNQGINTQGNQCGQMSQKAPKAKVKGTSYARKVPKEDAPTEDAPDTSEVKSPEADERENTKSTDLPQMPKPEEELKERER